MNKTNRYATLFLATFALASQLARGQTTAVAEWNGDNASPHGLWGNPAQWKNGTVPINNANTNFVVLIPDNSGVDFDRGTSNFIQAFSLGSGAELNFGPGQALTVKGDAQLGGVISATGANSAFWSLATNAIFIGYPRMLASQGGTVGTRISSYFYPGDDSQTILQADGPSALIDLTYARTMRITSGNWWGAGLTRRITAKNEGLVDLSGLVRIDNQTGSGPDTRSDCPNTLELNVENGGRLDLHSLEQISGWSTRFNVRVTNFALPALERASYTVFNVDSNCTVVVTNLVSLAGSMVNLATNATFLASNLVDFQDCQITLAPGRRFQTLPLLNFDNTRLYVQERVNYANVAATSYRDSHDWDVKLFEADGQGSVLDLSSVQTMRITSGNWWGAGLTRRITAKNEGLVDLSGLVRIDNQTGSGPDTRSDCPNALELNQESKGRLDLSSLEEISGWSTRINSRSGTLALPNLASANCAWFNISAGQAIDCPELLSLNGSGLSIGFAATFNAPQLTSFTDSSLSLAPGQTFTSSTLTNIDYSRIYLQGAMGFHKVAATSYFDSHNWDVKLFEADGRGSVLDLSSLQTMRITSCCGWDNGFTRRITAKNEGLVDLSGLVRIDNQTGGGPDIQNDPPNALELNINSKGDLDLTSLQEIAGYSTRFNVGVTNYFLPNLGSVNQTTFNIDFGAGVIAPKLTNFASSAVVISPGKGFAHGPIVNFSGSKIHVLGGETFAVAAPTYSNGRGDTAEMLKADGEANGARSYLDLRSVWNVTCHGGVIVASSRGIVDLSNAIQINGNGSWFELKASGAGELRLGDAVVSGNAKITLQGDTDRLVAGGLDLRFPARLSVGTGGEMLLQKNFTFDNTTASDVSLDSAVARFIGTGGQMLEVGGIDNGTGVTSGNFGLGMMVVGASDQPSTVKLMDLKNNGNRAGTAGTSEALYLFGANGGNGLRLLRARSWS